MPGSVELVLQQIASPDPRVSNTTRDMAHRSIYGPLGTRKRLRKLPLSSNSLYHLRANWESAMCSRKRSFHGISMPGRIHGHAGPDFAG